MGISTGLGAGVSGVSWSSNGVTPALMGKSWLVIRESPRRFSLAFAPALFRSEMAK
eukprot:CAMPEP_0182579488 /NCGR_PEP_ID=MMETSP1324-20130603/44287_1 /TAXON_ID=236786 /ORGANISM="Florenciella sp., Strain RCC1587" /LENGTH=55 /DNA_ID=CAMNT_0024795589 /DNA_START=77 /DNA_END=244 /DNA_ORIENTATION=-